MMYDSRIQYAMDNFIEENYFLPMQNQYELLETAESGKSCLNLQVNDINICVKEYDSLHKCAFLRIDKKYGMQKCIDHFVLKKQNDVWDLYMIEMKSSVGDKKWREIKAKVRSSYLNIRGLCEFLGITIGKVFTYTTYERERFNRPSNTADLMTLIPPLGEKATNFKKDEWDKGIINIKIDDIIPFPHKAVKMERNSNDVLEGNLQI